MPEEGADVCAKDDLLRADEIVQIAQVAREIGITKVRLTGGEPLVRKDLAEIVTGMAEIGFEDLSVTTNGFLLADQAKSLKKAGLQRVNISLDTLREGRFHELARRGTLDGVLHGIEAAKAAGLSPIKINCVAVKGFNDDEAIDFANLTLNEPVHVRFIELMPIAWNLDEDRYTGAPEFSGSSLLSKQALLSPKSAKLLDGQALQKAFISSDELQQRIESHFGPLHPASVPTNGPARTYRIGGASGTIGFISQISNDLCLNCNRLRLTADGFLRPCLMADGEADLRRLIRSGASPKDLTAVFEHVIFHKPARHYLADGQAVLDRSMSQIGG
jgi:GTP 3',8-cyclase